MKRHLTSSIRHLTSDIIHLTSSLFLLTSYIILLTSCDYKDLCYDHNHYGDVTVSFDWEKEPQTQVGGMTVLFYDLDAPGAEPLRYDFAGMEGGHARLQPGTYRAIAYNYDTETILYRGYNDDATLEAYTRQSSIEEGTQLSRSGMPRAANTEDEPVILEPDPLFGAVSETFTVELNGKSTVVMKPESRVTYLTITITDVPNLQYSSQFGGALSGLSPSVAMASGVPGDGHVTQAFPVSVVGESTLEAHVRIFGHCPHAADGELWLHLLTIYAVLADGSKWYYTIDVGDQLHDGSGSGTGTGDHDKEITIEVDGGLPVPKPIVNGSGFQPTIDGWQGEEIEVTMDN